MTIGSFATNSNGWFRRRNECFQHRLYSHLVIWLSDLSSPQMKAQYLLSRRMLDSAYSSFTGSGRQWLLHVFHYGIQVRGCVFHAAKAFVKFLTTECSLKDADVIYAIDYAYRCLCRGPRSFSEVAEYFTKFKEGVIAIVSKSKTLPALQAALAHKINHHVWMKRLHPYGTPSDDRRARTYLDYGKLRQPSDMEVARAAQLTVVDDPELLYLDGLPTNLEPVPDVTNFVEQVLGNICLHSEDRVRHKDDST